MIERDAVDRRTMVSTLTEWPGDHLNIADVEAYVDKVLSHGHTLSIQDDAALPMAYVAYYDDAPTMFVTMVWTRPDLRGHGLARTLLRNLTAGTRKPVRLEVALDSPARHLYSKLGFHETGRNGTTVAMERHRTVAIMQPYLFPYLPYFHLVESADVFVSLDDVSFIRRGWINRNNVLVQGKPHRFTLPVAGASQNVPIRRTMTQGDRVWAEGFLVMLRQSYASAPFRNETLALVESVVLAEQPKSVAEVALSSIRTVLEYVGVEKDIREASSLKVGHSGARRQGRLIEIAGGLGAGTYVNAPGGESLYEAEDFAEYGIALRFIESELDTYPQQAPGFVEGLSIIDVLMNNPPATVRRLMTRHRLRPSTPPKPDGRRNYR